MLDKDGSEYQMSTDVCKDLHLGRLYLIPVSHILRGSQNFHNSHFGYSYYHVITFLQFALPKLIMHAIIFKTAIAIAHT